MIVKTCRIHGPLTESECYLHKRHVKNEWDCASCVRLKRKHVYHSDVHLAHIKYKYRYQKNPEYFISRVREWRESHKAEFSATQRIRRLKIKSIVLQHYSKGTPNCQLCNMHTIEYLCLDHIDGGGKQHRKEQKYGGDAYYWAMKNKLPQIFRVLCHNCNWLEHLKKLEPGKSKSTQSVRKARIDVLMHYSNGQMKCAICDVNDLRILTIDHIDGGGTAHRNQLGGSSLHLYRNIRKSGYPKEYQVLCLNHNVGKQK